jgi:signal peptidase II
LLKKAFILIATVLFLDQASKVWVKTNMHLDQSIPVFGNWFYIHFIENPGMAFGLEFWGESGKLMLTVFRILAAAGFTWYMLKLIREKAHPGLILSIALVLAGAVGNILDSVFYGVLFGESPYYSTEVAKFLPPDGGYAPLLHGHVVDMLYFPILDGYWPQWVPYIGGDRFQFFRPVFNIADSAISVGLAIIIIGQRAFFKKPEETAAHTEEIPTASSTENSGPQDQG